MTINLFSGNSLGDTGIAKFASSMDELCRLQILKLAACDLTSAAVETLTEKLLQYTHKKPLQVKKELMFGDF